MTADVPEEGRAGVLSKAYEAGARHTEEAPKVGVKCTKRLPAQAGTKGCQACACHFSKEIRLRGFKSALPSGPSS